MLQFNERYNCYNLTDVTNGTVELTLPMLKFN